jgi:hypothetical protein
MRIGTVDDEPLNPTPYRLVSVAGSSQLQLMRDWTLRPAVFAIMTHPSMALFPGLLFSQRRRIICSIELLILNIQSAPKINLQP